MSAYMGVWFSCAVVCEARGYVKMPSSITSPSYFLRRGLSLTWELAVFHILAGQQTPGSACIHPITLQHWGYSFNSLQFRISIFLLQLKWMQSELNVEEVVNDRSWKVGNNVEQC